jgi:DNA-binding CsgD family transcriptional regulator
MGNLELVQKIADGYTVKEIAIQTGFSEGTLRKKIYTLRRRTFSKSVAHLVANYLRKKIID